MEITWDATYIDLQNLIDISRGDMGKMKKYLVQFRDLIPPRIENLRLHMQMEDRKRIRQTLHQMSPQLQFFGIPEVVPYIQRLAYEYQTMPWKELEFIVSQMLNSLDGASKETEKILNIYFSDQEY